MVPNNQRPPSDTIGPSSNDEPESASERDSASESSIVERVRIDNRGANIGQQVTVQGDATFGPVTINPPSPSPPPPQPTPTTRPKLSVLFVASNPDGTDPLALGRELRLIRTAIERSRHRDRLVLETLSAATIHDVRRALLESHYDVLHISGHGDKEGLLFEDEMGQPALVPSEALAEYLTLRARTGPLRCVVLNACWTESTGAHPSMAVPYTVAMGGPLSESAAQEFSRGFYDALGAGLGYAEAFEEGRSCVSMAAPGSKFDATLMRGEQPPSGASRQTPE